MKKFICFLLTLSMVFSLAACSGTTASTTQSATTTEPSSTDTSTKEPAKNYDVLNVAVLVTNVGIPVLYAQDQGYFKDAGLNVNIEVFATGAPVNEAIAAGEIDIACSGFATVYSLANADCVYLADINTTGGMGLYVRPDSDVAKAGETGGMIGSADTIKGMTVLEPLGTAVQYMTECYAAAFGLEPGDLKQTNMEYASAYQAFITGEGDAMAANPPYSYQLEDAGYVKACSFEAATNVNMCDGCFARKEVADERADEVQLFINCLVRAMDELQDHDLRYDVCTKFYTENAQTFTESDLEHEIADRLYIGTDLMSKDDYVLGEAWVAITDFLVGAGKITTENAPNVLSSIDSTFVSNATGLTIKAGN